MADQHTAHGGHPDIDYAEHERTFAMFTAGVKWATIVVCLIVVGMYIFLV
jgi:hypothetical protein